MNSNAITNLFVGSHKEFKSLKKRPAIL